MLQEIRDSSRDVVALAAVPLVLVAIHFLLPSGVREGLALDHADPAVHAFLTAAYVHLGDAHLWNNVVGFVFAAGIAYLLCYNQSRRRWFWLSTLAFLTVLPVLTNLANYAFFQFNGVEPTSRGFSGVVSGYVGFVLVAHGRDLADRYSRTTAVYVSEGITLVLLAVLLFVYPETRSVAVVGLLGFGVVATFGTVAWRGLGREFEDEERRMLLVQVVYSGAVVAALVVFVWVLFPGTLVREGSTVNVFGHGVGFLSGFCISVSLLLTIR